MATRKIAFPPRAEQDAVVEKVDVMLHELDGLTSLAEESVALLRERRSALISAAVTGKIDVRGLAPQ